MSISKEIVSFLPVASDIKLLIEQSRQNVAVAVNAEITLLYWNVGKRINEEVLKNSRAEYGKQVVVLLAQQLSLNCAAYRLLGGQCCCFTSATIIRRIWQRMG